MSIKLLSSLMVFIIVDDTKNKHFKKMVADPILSILL